ncbi:MAG: peptide chain release factor-like protein [Bdellovibrionales bacterium]|nr:peptide chain release factor-like protein [Bdellovibrionales bacterium]
MGKFGVTPEKETQLLQQMEALGIREDDLEERFIRGSGAGGQKINKTSSCVQLVHRPTGIEVRCQRERSQALNRFFARRELCEKMLARTTGAKSRAQQERERIRRQKRRRSRRSKEKMLEEKRQTSEKKASRRPPTGRGDTE